MKRKIKDPKSLARILAGLRRKGKKIVFTNGCFDLLHVGHVRYLGQARRQGDLLVVGLNSDRSVRELKGPTRPLTPEAERAELLAALECVDYVTVFDQDTPLELIKLLAPDVLVKGGDWTADKIVGAGEVKSRGGKVVVAKKVEGRSTRGIIAEAARRFREETQI